MIATLAAALVLTLPRHALFGAALSDKPAGTTVTRVISQSAASRAGIQTGDVLSQLAGTATPTVASFLAKLHELHAGENVAVGIVRAGTARTIDVVLGTPANEKDPAVTTLYESVLVDGTLRRTLVTVPNVKRPAFPAVLLIGGIGCYSVDVAANPEDPYMRLAHDLSRAGFVTMRVEKSGIGDSQGPPCQTADFSSEEAMYAAALSALRSHANVDPRRVYLLGHSIGTVEAPRLAANQMVAGVIVAEAVGRDWPEYEIRNARRQLELSGSSPADTDQALIEKSACMNRLLFDKQPEKGIEQEMPFCKEPNGVYPVSAQYMQQVAALNVIRAWTRLNVPVLVIYGRSDFVTEQDDHVRIVNVINARRPGTAAYRSIAGMDHLLFTASTPKQALDLFSNGSPRRYDAALSAVIVKWLCRRESAACGKSNST